MTPLPHLHLELVLHLLLDLVQPVQLVLVGLTHLALLLGPQPLPMLRYEQLDERVVRLQLTECSVSLKAVGRDPLESFRGLALMCSFLEEGWLVFDPPY